MPNITVYIDASGRVAESTDYGSKLTAVGVAIHDSRISSIAKSLADSFPKWKDSGPGDVRCVLDLLSQPGVYLGIHAIDRNSPEWKSLIKDSETLQTAIKLQGKRPLGAIKPTNLLKFYLLAVATTLAAVRSASPEDGLVKHGAGDELNCRVICDNDISGTENTEIFQSIFLKGPTEKRGLAQFGIDFKYSSVRFANEAEERLLLLPDYVAGICQASASDEQRQFPVSVLRARRHYRGIWQNCRVARAEGEFKLRLEQILGPLVDQAKNFVESYRRVDS